MAIKVGQVRYNESTSYLTPLSDVAITMYTTTTGNTEFRDLALQANFQAGVTYYARVDLERINANDNMGNSGSGDNDPHFQIVEVKLYSNNSTQYQTIGDIIVVEPYEDNKEDVSTLEKEDQFIKWCQAAIANGSPNIDTYEGARIYYNNLYQEHQEKINQSTISISDIRSKWKVIELIFTPYVSSNILVFELRRVSYDHNHSGRIVKINQTDYDLASVNNILPVTTAEKIGIQSRPGSYLVINGEGMRVGKSGILEINSGISITTVGFAAPNGSHSSANINDFILDYIYTE